MFLSIIYTFERVLPAEHDVEDDSQGPGVRAKAVSQLQLLALLHQHLPLDGGRDLGRPVLRRAQFGGRDLHLYIKRNVNDYKYDIYFLYSKLPTPFNYYNYRYTICNCIYTTNTILYIDTRFRRK